MLVKIDETAHFYASVAWRREMAGKHLWLMELTGLPRGVVGQLLDQHYLEQEETGRPRRHAHKSILLRLTPLGKTYLKVNGLRPFHDLTDEEGWLNAHGVADWVNDIRVVELDAPPLPSSRLAALARAPEFRQAFGLPLLPLPRARQWKIGELRPLIAHLIFVDLAPDQRYWEPERQLSTFQPGGLRRPGRLKQRKNEQHPFAALELAVYDVFGVDLLSDPRDPDTYPDSPPLVTE